MVPLFSGPFFVIRQTNYVFLYLICGSFGQQINGTFVFCNEMNQNRIANQNFFCRPQRNLGKSLSDGYYNIWVLAENNYYINDYGYECFKSRNIRHLSESFFFDKYESVKKEQIHLSRMECLAMVESKRCDNRPMNCNNYGCSYKELPEGEFSWLSSKTYWNYECSFRKIKIIAESKNDTIYNFALNSCKPNDLYCQFNDRIIIWNENILRKFSHYRIHYGWNYTRKNSLVYSKEDRFLFQLVNSSFSYGLELFLTTDGLYIIFDKANDLMFSSKIHYFPYKLSLINHSKRYYRSYVSRK